MKQQLKLLILCLALPALANANPAFPGSDDFDAGLTNKWGYYFRIEGSGTNNGDLSFTNDRLDFTKGTGEGSYFLGWDGVPGPGNGVRNGDSFGTSWVMDLEVTNNANLGAGEFANIGFEAASDNLNFFALFLSNSEGQTSLRVESSGRQLVTSRDLNTGDDVLLRLMWDAIDQELAAAFSLDGGNSFDVLAQDFAPGDLGNWDLTPSNGFFFEVFGNSNAAGAINTGEMYADNFSLVAAVPAPATILLFLAGLVVLHRRRS